MRGSTTERKYTIPAIVAAKQNYQFNNSLDACCRLIIERNGNAQLDVQNAPGSTEFATATGPLFG